MAQQDRRFQFAFFLRHPVPQYARKLLPQCKQRKTRGRAGLFRHIIPQILRLQVDAAAFVGHEIDAVFQLFDLEPGGEPLPGRNAGEGIAGHQEVCRLAVALRHTQRTAQGTFLKGRFRIGLHGHGALHCLPGMPFSGQHDQKRE